MEKIQSKEIENIFCCECGETHLFRLKDKNHEFVLGLQDIIRCLHFAEKEGAVPKLPDDWWFNLRNRYINTELKLRNQ